MTNFRKFQLDLPMECKFAQEVFTPVRKKFQRERVTPKHIDETWSIDLIDLTKQSKYNKGYKFVFTCIDIFSKYAWAIPIKDKSSISVLNAFREILDSSKRKPKRIWSDKGKEFYNHQFLSYLKENDIELYSTFSELKAVFIERFNRTLRDLLKIPVFLEGKGNWLSHLNDVMKTYNERKHGTIKMSPIEGSKKENENTVYHNIADKPLKPRKPKLNVGDLVRVPDKRTIYSKGDTTNWGNELFRVYSIENENPPQYLIEDENGEKILGKHYEEELLKSNFSFQENKKVLKQLNLKLRSN